MMHIITGIHQPTVRVTLKIIHLFLQFIGMMPIVIAFTKGNVLSLTGFYGSEDRFLSLRYFYLT